MNRQSKNAARIVEALRDDPRIARIHYPSLFRDEEQVRIFRAQCRFPGAIFSMELRGGKAGAFEFLRRLRILRNAVSLGGMESLACHPATTTHSELAAPLREASGIADSLVRISVGVEDWRDLLDDLRQALEGVPSA
jgi:cystathionine beta-lyase/cystathionine gamma-synthase